MSARIILAFVWFSAQCAHAVDAAPPLVYETYYYCDPASEQRVDEIIGLVEKPVYDSEVEAQRLARWSWRSHLSGGRWRRMFVEAGTTDEALFDAQRRAGRAFANTYTEERDAFRRACRSHDDYIWRETHSAGASGPATLALYLQCPDPQGAAARITEAPATALERLVDEKQLTGWRLLSKRIGGPHNLSLRLQASDYLGALKAFDIVRASGTGALDQALLGCTREEYLWDQKF